MPTSSTRSANSPPPKIVPSWIACSTEGTVVRYLLDANAVIAVLNEPDDPVSGRLHA